MLPLVVHQNKGPGARAGERSLGRAQSDKFLIRHSCHVGYAITECVHGARATRSGHTLNTNDGSGVCRVAHS